MLYSALMHLVAFVWRVRVKLRHSALMRSKGSNYRLDAPCSRARLSAFAQLPGPAIWIHAASLGEVKAAEDLMARLRKVFPHCKFALSTLTRTGFSELERISLAGKELLPLYLPIDLPRYLRPIVDAIAPQLLIVVEGDVWLNFLRLLAQRGCFVTIVSGKISMRSYRRLQWARRILPQYWKRIDLICTQSIDQMERLRALGAPLSKLKNTGNLKLDRNAPFVDEHFQRALLHQMCWKEGDIAIVIASTHANEEKLVLGALWPFFQVASHIHLIVAPRHPERFSQVAAEITREFGAVTRWSQRDCDSPKENGARCRLHLIDAIGHLSDCYRMAKLAIVGGSYISKIGGHNIFEPILVQTPVLFGPHMDQQRALVELALTHRAGRQVDLENLRVEVEELLVDESALLELKRGTLRAASSASGTLDRTWQVLETGGAFRKLGGRS